MQYGIVNDALEGWITLTVLGADGAGERHEFFIDTGFYGELSLSQEVIDRLNLPASDRREVVLTLAGGSTRKSNLYEAGIFWHGRIREVNVVSLETDHLVGMGLLSGSNLSVDAVPGGAVVIAELSAPA